MENVEADWLSPTRAWRMMQCPASVRPLLGPPASPTDEGDPLDVNAGTLAHRVIERWIRSGGYREASPVEALSNTADECVADLRDGPPSGWALTHARLIARGPMLVDLIGPRTSEQIHSEVELWDPRLRLRGKPDLVLLGDEVVVLDFKTQTFRESDLPEWVKFQLAIYAHLIEDTFGTRPDRAGVFSLSRGQIPVSITDAEIEAALAAVSSARQVGPDIAHPSLEVCRYCLRRFECEPHWQAVATWPEPDCIEGAIDRVEVAANGVAAVRVTTATGASWVTRVPAHLVTGVAGQSIRFVRIRSIRTENGDAPDGWIFSRGSALQCNAAPAPTS